MFVRWLTEIPQVWTGHRSEHTSPHEGWESEGSCLRKCSWVLFLRQRTSGRVALGLSWGLQYGDRLSRFAMPALFQVARVLGPVLGCRVSACGLWWGSELSRVYSGSRTRLRSVPMAQGAASITEKTPCYVWGQAVVLCRAASSSLGTVCGCLRLSPYRGRNITEMLIPCNAPDRPVPWKLLCWKRRESPCWEMLSETYIEKHWETEISPYTYVSCNFTDSPVE